MLCRKRGGAMKACCRLGIILSIAALIAVPAIAQQSSPQQNATHLSHAPLTNQDVLAMQNSGLAPEIIVAKIKSSLCDFDTSPAELERLRGAKVPNDVILAMVQFSAANGSTPAIESAPASAENTAEQPGGYLGFFMVNAKAPAHGVLVKNVAPDSPAARAGMQKGDILEAINEQPIASIGDYHQRFDPLKPATDVALRILRKGQESQLTATIAPLRATVTFVTVENGQVLHVLPNWAATWVRKNMEKYPDVRFQMSGPASGEGNYVIAFSFSSNALNGFEPVTHTETSSSTSDVSGTGTVTDDQGNSWDYTINGNADTTTTTTKTTNEPFTRTFNTIYLTAYNAKGEVIAQRWRVFASQQGGDPYNSAGYNLGSALGAIHARAELMQAVLKDIGLAKPKKKKKKN